MGKTYKEMEEVKRNWTKQLQKAREVKQQQADKDLEEEILEVSLEEKETN